MNHSTEIEVLDRPESLRARFGAKATGATIAVVGATGMLAPLAGAATPSETTTAVSGGASTIKDELLAIGTTVLPYAAAVFALMFGWRLAKRIF